MPTVCYRFFSYLRQTVLILPFICHADSPQDQTGSAQHRFFESTVDSYCICHPFHTASVLSSILGLLMVWKLS